MEGDLSEILANYVVSTNFAALPLAAKEKARQSTLDTIGVIMAASALEPSVNGLVDLVLEAGGRTESTVLGTGQKVPAIMAAFANGGLAHSLDFDDHAPEGHHPSSSAIPVSLALAERLGDVTGEKFLTAVAIGQDIFMRLRRNVVWKHDWHLTTIIGVFSATASAAYLLGLNRDQIASAFGIAGVQSAGTYELVQGVNNEVRGMYAAFISKAAIVAALMAQKNIKGPRSIFDGKNGFFNVYFDGKYDRKSMLNGLGQDFQGAALLYKPWPSCGLSHTYIHAARRLMAENDLVVEQIEAIRIFAGAGQIELCEPLESRCKPKTSSDAKFSIPFCVAITLMNGTVKPTDFLPEALKDPKILAVAAKTVIVFDSNSNWDGHLPDGRIEVILKNGQSFSCVGSDVPGNENVPMSWDELIEKYKDCVRASKVRLSDDTIDKTARLFRELERVGNMTEITDLLAGGRTAAG